MTVGKKMWPKRQYIYLTEFTNNMCVCLQLKIKKIESEISSLIALHVGIFMTMCQSSRSSSMFLLISIYVLSTLKHNCEVTLTCHSKHDVFIVVLRSADTYFFHSQVME